jgi:alpha-beta hydrolase superfamily lysophospholipase
MQEETFEGFGGLKLALRSFRPEGSARGVVVINHGFKAYGGLYEWVGGELAKRGFSTFALDMRGHGRSEGEPLFVEHMSEYVADLDALVELAKTRAPGLPVFVLGHSAGGVVSCLYALEHQKKLAGFVCESFAHELPAPDFALAVLKGVGHVAPHAHVLKLKDEDFSRDPAFVARMHTDPLVNQAGYPSSTVAELVRSDERLKQEFGAIELPLLILHGSADRAAKPHGSQVFFERTGSSDKTLKLYDGYFHDLLNDLGKEIVLADIVEWLELRAARA